MKSAREKLSQLSRPGTVRWIGVRPGRRENVVSVEHVAAVAGTGLDGDHFAGKRGSGRQVTLVQYEHLQVIGEILGRDAVDPSSLRRNIAVSGINLLTLRERRFKIGTALLEGSGACHPCSRMEENLGEGGLNAMRGHGGLTARIIESGEISVGDSVVDLGTYVTDQDSSASS